MSIAFFALAVIGGLVVAAVLVIACIVFIPDLVMWCRESIEPFRLRHFTDQWMSVRVCVRSKDGAFSRLAEDALQQELAKYHVTLRHWPSARVSFRMRNRAGEMAYNMSRRIAVATKKPIPLLFAQVFTVWDEPIPKGELKRQGVIGWLGGKPDIIVDSEEDWKATAPIYGSAIELGRLNGLVPELARETAREIALCGHVRRGRSFREDFYRVL